MFSEKLQQNLQGYLSSVYQSTVRLISTEKIGQLDARELKSFGYGKPYRITFEVNRQVKTVVLETMAANSFGHDHFSDRAQILLWSHSAYNTLPDHVRSVDAGAFTRGEQMISLGEATEFFLLSEFVEGHEYAADLRRILSDGKLMALDRRRTAVLAEYLAKIHSRRIDAPHLYRRRIRELLGHGECIMGLIDNYPQNDPVATPDRLQKIEMKCLQWRWKIKTHTERLSQVHGDFHPWNILFREDVDFTVLDRSRGEWGEPADDVSSMMINYLFLALQKEMVVKGVFQELYSLFWNTYFDLTHDTQMIRVIQPFIAWRGLVLCNPTWYPKLPVETRERILRLIENVLSTETFDHEKVDDYIE